MGCDAMVAPGTATAKGQTVFGVNSHGPVGICRVLSLERGRPVAAGETVGTRTIPVPQAKQTYTVLGSRSPNDWGYRHGVNEHRLAAACSDWQSKLAHPSPGLFGTELVRVVLERCQTARQAFELLTTLISKHGQGGTSGYATEAGTDNIFLLADPRDAYVVEAAGSAWAALECQDVRAVSDLALIRQDWQRLSPGLGEQVIAQGWWHDDGSKLDFSASLSVDQTGTDSALRRWGRATLLLEQQRGKLDAASLRQVLGDHYDGTSHEVDPLAPDGPTPLCRHAGDRKRSATAGSLIAELPSDVRRPALAWCVYGPPCAGIYLPIFLAGALPDLLSRSSTTPDVSNLWWRVQALHGAARTDPQQWGHMRSSLALLQARIDQETEEFCHDLSSGPHTGDVEWLRRETTLFMQNNAEQLEAEFQRIQSVLAGAAEGLVV